jgi:hypothetical protein
MIMQHLLVLNREQFYGEDRPRLNKHLPDVTCFRMLVEISSFICSREYLLLISTLHLDLPQGMCIRDHTGTDVFWN